MSFLASAHATAPDRAPEELSAAVALEMMRSLQLSPPASDASPAKHAGNVVSAPDPASVGTAERGVAQQLHDPQKVHENVGAHGDSNSVDAKSSHDNHTHPGGKEGSFLGTVNCRSGWAPISKDLNEPVTAVTAAGAATGGAKAGTEKDKGYGRKTRRKGKWWSCLVRCSTSYMYVIEA